MSDADARLAFAHLHPNLQIYSQNTVVLSWSPVNVEEHKDAEVPASAAAAAAPPTN
jgi:hypothetical protein